MFSNRGFTDSPDDPDAPVSIFAELGDTREEGLVEIRALYMKMPAIHACLRTALAAQSIDSSLHARFLVQSGALTIESSPATPSLDACLLGVAAAPAWTGRDRFIASVAITPDRYAHVLPVHAAAAGTRLIRDAGGCYAFESSNCGPADDCPLDGFRPGLCDARPPARIRLHLEPNGNIRAATRFERIGSDGQATYVAALPFPIPLDDSRSELDLAEADTDPMLGYVAMVSTGAMIAIVSDGGALVLRARDGDVRFAEPANDRETLGYDDAHGVVTVGRKRCPFGEAHRGRLAIACGDRIVLLRGGSIVYVLDANGTIRVRRELQEGAEFQRGLFSRIDARIETVRLQLEGRIYVH